MRLGWRGPGGSRFRHETGAILLPQRIQLLSPGYVIPGTNLLGPEFEIFNTSTTISRTNFVNDLVYSQVTGTTTVDLSGYVPLAAMPDQWSPQ